jgi:signal transduction histidine kinase
MKNFCIVFTACFTCFALGNISRTAGVLNFKPARTALESKAIVFEKSRSVDNAQVQSGKSGRWIFSHASLLMLSLAGLGDIALATMMLLQRQQQKIRANEACAIAEQERKRIAREIHDSLQQQLSGAALHLATLKGAMQAAPLMMPRLIDEVTAMIRHCQIETRHCIWDLRSAAPKNENFADTLVEWMRMRGARVRGTKLHFGMSGEMPPMSEDVLFQVMRIIQEAVNNGLAHADARHVNVWLEGTPHELFLTVKDDGRGFQPYDLCEGHFGISGQRERAQRIGAKLVFSSAPGIGTRVLLRVPAHQHSHV